MKSIINYELTAASFSWNTGKGKEVGVMGFNHQLPGPVLRGKKGQEMIVRFTNTLNEPTLIHWHGLKVTDRMDGTDLVQQPVAPGQSFEYRIPLTDAGTFWYHSHFNETFQLERGMYGALVVEDENDPGVDAERVLVLDDMKLTRNGKHAEPGWFFSKWIERHNGREGNTQLLNGQIEPVLELAAGQVERWRLVNASNARYYRLSFGAKKFRIIATDGGLLEEALEADELLMAPGERYDILMQAKTEGERFDIISLPYNRGLGKGKEIRIAEVSVGVKKPSRAFIPERLRSIQPLAQATQTANRQIILSGTTNLKRGVDFHVNGIPHLNDAPVLSGQLQVWEISNPSMMDHPFHLHGFFFQVLQVNGEAPAYRSWKDTFNIRKGDVVKIAWMPDERKGKWMYHCHILEHHAAGMMAAFDIVSDLSEAESKPVSHHHHH